MFLNVGTRQLFHLTLTLLYLGLVPTWGFNYFIGKVGSLDGSYEVLRTL